jgi:hypothetical protein
MRCLFSNQLKINSFDLTLSRNHVHPGARLSSSRVSTSFVKMRAELAGVKRNVVFRMKCVRNDTSVADAAGGARYSRSFVPN